MNTELKNVNDIIKFYNIIVKGIKDKAEQSEDRSFGGMIRATKGIMVETICKTLITLVYEKTFPNKEYSLSFEKQNIKIPIKDEYISALKDPEVREYILSHKADYYYGLKTDVHVHLNNKFICAIECKAYTENAMLKRILVDFTLLREVCPDLVFVLFQLESQLGGDYSKYLKGKFGSPSTHTLLSYFNTDIHFITLLEGERKVNAPIHDRDYFKPLDKKRLNEVISFFSDILKSQAL